MDKIKEWLGQLSLIFKKKTIDALFPPLIFFIANQFLSLTYASGLTLLYLALLVLYRIIKKHTKRYVLVGVGGVLFSISLSFLSGEAIYYYLPGLITTSLIVILCITSLIVKNPLAAWVSHLTRGWPIDWYFRDDIRPAYKKVTLLWALYFLTRLMIQLPIFLTGNYSLYFVVNSILGWPMNIVLLIATYALGISSLRKLSGPSVSEFKNKEEPPYEGQKTGF